jgi:translation initiation factor IF-2
VRNEKKVNEATAKADNKGSIETLLSALQKLRLALRYF